VNKQKAANNSRSKRPHMKISEDSHNRLYCVSCVSDLLCCPSRSRNCPLGVVRIRRASMFGLEHQGNPGAKRRCGPGAIRTLDRPVSSRSYASYEPVALTRLSYGPDSADRPDLALISESCVAGAMIEGDTMGRVALGESKRRCLDSGRMGERSRFSAISRPRDLAYAPRAGRRPQGRITAKS
jgi:hypothetical protein